MKKETEELTQLKYLARWVGFSGISLLPIVYHKEIYAVMSFKE